VANNDDVSDVDDVDLERRWDSAYRSLDRRNREIAEETRPVIYRRRVSQRQSPVQDKHPLHHAWALALIVGVEQ